MDVQRVWMPCRSEWERFVTKIRHSNSWKFSWTIYWWEMAKANHSVGFVCVLIPRQHLLAGSQAGVASGWQQRGICGWSLKVAWILGWTVWRTYCFFVLLMFFLSFSLFLLLSTRWKWFFFGCPFLQRYWWYYFCIKCQCKIESTHYNQWWWYLLLASGIIQATKANLCRFVPCTFLSITIQSRIA